MALILASVVITVTFILLGMFLVGRAGKRVSIAQLQVFIALAAGFMMVLVFTDLIPHNIAEFPDEPRTFFLLGLSGMALVILAERYLTPRLTFLENVLHSGHSEKIHIHEHAEGEDCHHHEHSHGQLEEADHCESSHEHGHLHQHTHPELIGKGEVCSAVACFMICSFFDGVSLASIQAVDSKLGLLMIVGVVLHLLPEGILSGMLSLAGGASLDAAKKVVLLIGGSFLLGALVPFALRGYEIYLMAVSSGILIFVTMVQLLPTALRVRWAPLWLFSGAGLFLIFHGMIDFFGIAAHHH